MIRAEGLSLHVGGHAILADVSCRVRPGRVTVAMGKNGAGKSTLLNLLAGRRPEGGTFDKLSGTAAAGAVYVDGRCLTDIAPPELARRRAVLAQSVHLGFPLSVAEVVELGCYNRYDQLTALERRHRVAHYLDLLELTAFRNRAFPTLSGGEQKRALLAKCLLQLDGESAAPDHHKYLLLDEPTAALDIEQQYRFFALATDLARRSGYGVFAVLHDLNLAARFADDLVFLREGRVVAAGPKASALNQTTIQETFDVDCLLQDHPHHDGLLITTIPYEPTDHNVRHRFARPA